MADSRLTISIFLLRIIYKIVCGFVSFMANSKKLIKIKVAIGTLILTLNSTLSFSQEKSEIPNSIYSKNDTLNLNITIVKDTTPIEEIVFTCYYGGPPSYKEPTFYGGEEALNKFIAEELVYPKKAIKKKTEGVVELSYTIDSNGKVKDATILKGLGNGCDEEALRIVMALPNYSKGYKNRKPLEFEKTIKIEFKLPGE